MRILLTGATGFLGSRTLEKLSENPDVELVIASGRNIKPTHYLSHSKIKYDLGDLSEPEYVDRIVKEVDCIIHAAALSSPWGRYPDFESANITSQVNLLNAAKKYGVKRYIFISTPSVYFELKDLLNIKESDPLPKKFINAYAATKRQAEIALINSSIPYVILRPRGLIGRGDTVIMPRLIRAFEEGKLKIIGNGKNRVDLTAVTNVVHAIERSMLVKEPGLNQIYNISNGDPVLLWESIEKVLSLLGYRLSDKKLPYPLVKTIAQLMEWKSRNTDYKEPVLTTYGVGTLARSFTLDITKARNLLSYEPRVTINEAMEEFATWYMKIK